jgi:hypothetical protein
MTRLRRLLGRLRLRSLAPEEYEDGGRRPFDSVDALAAGAPRGEKAAAQGGEYPGSVAANYIKTTTKGGRAVRNRSRLPAEVAPLEGRGEGH